jgi:primosomal protein N' (replication factor Y)
MIADVVFTHGPPQPLSYRVPEELVASMQPGCRVVAPVRNKKRIGVVWSTVAENGAEALKTIHELVDARPILSAEQIAFAQWLSSYYHSPLSSVLSLFVPKLLMEPDSLLIQSSPRQSEPLPEWQSDFLQYLSQGRPLKVSTLRDKVGGGSDFYRKIAQLEEDRLVTISYSRSRRRIARGKLVSLARPFSEPCRLGSKQKLLVYHLENAGKPVDMTILMSRLSISRKSIEGLAAKGVVSIRSAQDVPDSGVSVQELMLNREQMDAVEAVSKAVKAREFSVFLLHGVTGSGKTEVYVKLIWDALELGRTALLLQPEIALSEQVYSKLSSRFGDRVCRLHSNVAASERYAIFKGIQSGEIRVVIGPRSAMFSSLTKIGLVIVDEEHDQSYKQSGKSPLYQGRDAAVMWGRFNSCPVLLGSATPSVESWGNAAQGKYTLLKLTRRWDEREMPEVRVVVHKPAIDGDELLSEHLAQSIADNVAKGAQTVLFLNRRGFAPTVKCMDCRTSLRCPNCDIGLVYHLSRKFVMCHLCGFTSDLIHSCPTCNGFNWGYFGAGTQRIEEYLNRRFPSARIGRLDVDAAAKSGSAGRLLLRFAKGKVDILVGTQMVAKGLDFPGVRTVGILSADSSMNMPDFRAVERTYALIYQASGRAGRGKYAGEVVIQVESEDSPLARPTKESDFCDFLDEEYHRREELNYPPHSHLIMIRLSAGAAETVETAAFELQKGLVSRRRRYERFMEVLGPAPAPFFKVKNNYRWRILIKTSSVSSSLAFMDRFLDDSESKDILKNVRLVIDVDPYDMM